MGIIGIITKKINPKNCIKLGFYTPIILLLTNKKIKLILHEGTIKIIKKRNKIKAGEIMFEFPDCVVCHANSFFLGKPIPILSMHDNLIAGHTYFIFPLDRLPGPPEGSDSRSSSPILSTASLCSLGSPSGRPSPTGAARSPPVGLVKLLNGNNNNYSNNNNGSPFEYVKDKDGRVVLIKVIPEFITRIITSNNNGPETILSSSPKLICNTPELQKQYEQLVKAKDQAWSPKLETITEQKNNYIKFSPSRLIRLEWRQK